MNYSIFNSYFYEKVHVYSTKIALSFTEGGSTLNLTYTELDALSNQWARYLSKNYDIKLGSKVCIYSKRNPCYPIVFLALMKLGAIYIPVDPNTKKEQVEAQFKDCKPDLVITDSEKVSRLQNRDLKPLDIENVNYQGELIDQIACQQDDPTFYYIYSSGTTGEPKGIPHKQKGLLYWEGIINQLLQDQETKTINVLGNTSLSHDPHIWEYLMAWCSGGTLFFTSMDTHGDMNQLISFINDNKITDALFSPSMLSNLLEYEPLKNFSENGFKTFYLTGEAISRSLLTILQSYGIRVINCFGPTELYFGYSAKVVTVEDIDKESGVIAIGEAQGNEVISYVYPIVETDGDTEVKYDPKGPKNIAHVEGEIEGELLVHSPYMTEGYLNNEGLTKKQFIDVEHDGKSLSFYRTGDIVSKKNGQLLPRGRVGDRVKINLVWVNLATVRDTVLKYPGLEGEKIVCLVEKDDSNNKYLFVFLSKDIDKQKLSKYIVEEMSPAEKPQHIICLKDFPLINGYKPNKKALRDEAKLIILEQNRVREIPEKFDYSNEDIVKGYDEIKLIVKKIIANVMQLDLHEVMDDSNLKEIIPNSINATKIMGKIYRLFNANLSPVYYKDLKVKDLQLDLFRIYAILLTCHQFKKGIYEEDFILKNITNNTDSFLFFTPPVTGTHPENTDYLSRYDNAVVFNMPLTHLDHFNNEKKYSLIKEAFETMKINDLGRVFMNAIRVIQPEGYYNIAGWSFGGWIAYFSAIEFERRNCKLHSVSIIDSANLQIMDEMSDSEIVIWLNGVTNNVLESLGYDNQFNINIEDKCENGETINRYFRELKKEISHQIVINTNYPRLIAIIDTTHMNLLSIFSSPDDNIKLNTTLTIFQSEKGLFDESICSRDDWKNLSKSINFYEVENTNHVTVLFNNRVISVLKTYANNREMLDSKKDWAQELSYLMKCFKDNAKILALGYRGKFVEEHISDENYIVPTLLKDYQATSLETVIELLVPENSGIVDGQSNLNNRRAVFVEGESGSGKSSLCQYILNTLCQQNKDELETVVLPLQIKYMDNFLESIENLDTVNQMDSLELCLRFISYYISQKYNFQSQATDINNIIRNALNKIEQGHRLQHVLILDGLDEIDLSETYMAKDVKVKILKKLISYNCFITSKIKLPEYLKGNNITEYRISPFADSDFMSFLKKQNIGKSESELLQVSNTIKDNHEIHKLLGSQKFFLLLLSSYIKNKSLVDVELILGNKYKFINTLIMEYFEINCFYLFASESDIPEVDTESVIEKSNMFESFMQRFNPNIDIKQDAFSRFKGIFTFLGQLSINMVNKNKHCINSNEILALLKSSTLRDRISTELNNIMSQKLKNSQEINQSNLGELFLDCIMRLNIIRKTIKYDKSANQGATFEFLHNYFRDGCAVMYIGNCLQGEIDDSLGYTFRVHNINSANSSFESNLDKVTNYSSRHLIHHPLAHTKYSEIKVTKELIHNIFQCVNYCQVINMMSSMLDNSETKLQNLFSIIVPENLATISFIHFRNIFIVMRNSIKFVDLVHSKVKNRIPALDLNFSHSYGDDLLELVRLDALWSFRNPESNSEIVSRNQDGNIFNVFSFLNRLGYCSEIEDIAIPEDFLKDIIPLLSEAPDSNILNVINLVCTLSPHFKNIVMIKEIFLILNRRELTFDLLVSKYKLLLKVNILYNISNELFFEQSFIDLVRQSHKLYSSTDIANVTTSKYRNILGVSTKYADFHICEYIYAKSIRIYTQIKDRYRSNSECFQYNKLPLEFTENSPLINSVTAYWKIQIAQLCRSPNNRTGGITPHGNETEGFNDSATNQGLIYQLVSNYYSLLKEKDSSIVAEFFPFKKFWEIYQKKSVYVLQIDNIKQSCFQASNSTTSDFLKAIAKYINSLNDKVAINHCLLFLIITRKLNHKDFVSNLQLKDNNSPFYTQLYSLLEEMIETYDANDVGLEFNQRIYAPHSYKEIIKFCVNPHLPQDIRDSVQIKYMNFIISKDCCLENQIALEDILQNTFTEPQLLCETVVEKLMPKFFIKYREHYRKTSESGICFDSYATVYQTQFKHEYVKKIYESSDDEYSNNVKFSLKRLRSEPVRIITPLITHLTKISEFWFEHFYLQFYHPAQIFFDCIYNKIEISDSNLQCPNNHFNSAIYDICENLMREDAKLIKFWACDWLIKNAFDQLIKAAVSDSEESKYFKLLYITIRECFPTLSNILSKFAKTPEEEASISEIKKLLDERRIPGVTYSDVTRKLRNYIQLQVALNKPWPQFSSGELVSNCYLLDTSEQMFHEHMEGLIHTRTKIFDITDKLVEVVDISNSRNDFCEKITRQLVLEIKGQQEFSNNAVSEQLSI